MDRDNILEDLKKLCCADACLLQHFSVDSILLFREQYSRKDEKGRTDMLRRYAESAYTIVGGKVCWKWQMQGHMICEKAFILLCGCSYYKLSKAKKTQNQDIIVHGNQGKSVYFRQVLTHSRFNTNF